VLEVESVEIQGLRFTQLTPCAAMQVADTICEIVRDNARLVAQVPDANTT
jgi:hypothetical protein